MVVRSVLQGEKNLKKLGNTLTDSRFYGFGDEGSTEEWKQKKRTPDARSGIIGGDGQADYPLTEQLDEILFLFGQQSNLPIKIGLVKD